MVIYSHLFQQVAVAYNNQAEMQPSTSAQQPSTSTEVVDMDSERKT